jgi:hypothetical protein
VGIELDREAGSEEPASFGAPTALPHRLPLTYHGELLGQPVIDDGVGLDVRNGFGLELSSKAEEIAASGTRVSASLPLPREGS